MENEIWKDVPGYEGKYQASSLGVVRSVPRKIICKNGKPKTVRGGVLNAKDNGKGYLLAPIGPNRWQYIHRVVALTFIPNPARFKEVNHIDHDKSNNAVTNLEWVSRIGNVRHSINAGRYDEARKMQSAAIRGSRHTCAKRNESEILKIRERYESGERPCDLRREFKMTISSLEKIIYRKTWRHI